MYALSFDMRSNLFALLAKNIAELEEWSDFTESVRNG